MAVFDRMKSVTGDSSTTQQTRALDMQDALYQASLIAVKSELQKAGYDVTKQCVVIDDEKWETGEYRVRLGTTPFTAYSNDIKQHYLPNEIVYVQIPKGDMEQQKFIIGRFIDEEDENAMYHYEFPFEDFVALKKLIEPSPDKHGFLANKNFIYNGTGNGSAYQSIYNVLTLSQKETFSLDELHLERQTTYYDGTTNQPVSEDNDILIGSWVNSADTPGPTIGNMLGVTVKVQTLLDSQRPIYGTYGLRIHITGLLKSTDENSQSTTSEQDKYFYSTEMYGNPYVFTMPKEQQCVFDVSEYLRIEKVEVYFVQDCLFFNQYNEYIGWQRTNGLLDPNIIMSDLGVFLGFKASELGRDQVFLYTYDSTIFGENPDSLVDRSYLDRKTMYVAFVHYDSESETYKLYDSQEEFDDAGYEIFWYTKDPNWYLDAANPAYEETKPEHKYGGLYWGPMSGEDTAMPTTITQKSTPIYSRTSYSFVPDMSKSAYRFRAAVRADSGHCISDILVFKNQKDVETELQDIARNDKVIIRIGTPMTAVDRASTIIYEHSDFTNFFVYDENNNALISDDKRTYTKGDVTYKFPDQQRYSDISWYAEIWIKEDVFKDTATTDTVESQDGYVRLADYCYAFDVDSTTGLPVEKYVPFDVEWSIIPDPSLIENFRELDASATGLPYYVVRNNQIVNFDYSPYGDKKLETKLDVDKMTTRMFNIAPTYDINANHNTISATIRRNGQEFTAKCELLFGRASAQGCPYTPVIQIIQPVGNTHVIANVPFKMQCVIQDNYGKIYQGGFSCEWTFLGNIPSYTISNYVPESGLEGENTIVTGTVHDDGDCKPFSVICKISKTSGTDAVPIDYEIYATRGILVGSANAASWLANHSVNAVSRVEFDADGQAPHYASQMFKVIGPPKSVTEAQLTILQNAATYMRKFIDEHDPTDQNTTMARYVRERFQATSNTPDNDIATLEAVVGISLDTMTLADIRQITEKEYIYPTWHLHTPVQLKDIVRLYDEPMYTTVVRQVKTNDAYDPLKYYQLYNAEKNYYYAVDYNEYDTDSARNAAFTKDKETGLLFYRECKEYIAFYNGTTATMPNVAQYYLKFGPDADPDLPAQDYQTSGDESTAWQWKDEYLTNPYFTWLSFQYKDITNNKTIKVSQGIAYFRYLYSSSLVDQWDGASLTLDQETSTIIAKRIAAGTKNSRNQFTGVMMGAFTGYTSNTIMKNKTGIYGFNDGAISFGLMDDGTGFIGPAGAGRIQFDGRNALISNSTKTCYINLNPSQLTYGNADASSAEWNDTSNMGLTPYFLYCKVPVDVYRTLSSSQTDYADQELEWAKPFLEDTTNNYFIVDPNKGTVISAGIATRYGRIGNWFINDTGLYQQYENPDDPSKSRFMYLGMPTYNMVTEDDFKAQLGSMLAGFTAYKNEHQNDTGFSNLTDVEILYRYQQQRRQNVLDDIPDEWTPASLEERVRMLGKYLNYSEFGMDVYHFYTFGTAARNVSRFLKKQLGVWKSYPANLQTPEMLWNLIYDNGGQAMQEITQIDTSKDDWSNDGPLSTRNIETYLHNHYDTAPAGGRTVTYYGKDGTTLQHTYAVGEVYRNTQRYGYLTSMNNLLNGYNVSTSLSCWDPEVKPDGTWALDESGNYPDASMYVDWQDIYPYNGESDKAAYIRVTEIGDVAPRLRNSPTITTTNGSSTVTATFSINSYVSTSDVSLPATSEYISLNSSQIRLTNNGLQRGRGTVDSTWLAGYCSALDEIYTYYKKCFNKQLSAMLESGLNILQTKDPEAYEEVSQILEMMGGLEAIAEGGLDILDESYTFTDGLSVEAIARAEKERQEAHKKEQEAKLEALDKEYAEVMDRINKNADPNRYAIYAGYESPLTCHAADAPNPFFSVRWNGYMTARHGKIGQDSPWYISDAGLTQKNNSGIIFLGDPGQDGSDSKQTNSVGGHNGTKALFTDEFGDSLNCQLLPNGSTLNGQIAYVDGSGATGGIRIAKHYATWSDAAVQDQNENYVYGENSSITYLNAYNQAVNYSGSDLQYLGPEAFGTYGNFAIYAGTEYEGINFGVRMDGTVFCKRLQAYEARIIGGSIDGAVGTNLEQRYGWPQPGEAGSNVSYTVPVEVTITNFTAQNSMSGLEDNEKLSARIEAGGSIYVYQGGLQANHSTISGVHAKTNLQIESLTITNISAVTKVTVNDSAGTRYFFYDATRARWKMTVTGFTSMHIETTQPDGVIGNYIAGKDAILLGGSLSGWVLGSSSIYIKRSGVIGAGASEWLYSIHLDGANNQITLANSQIVLDGTNGIIFIGRPTFNGNNSALQASFTTDSHLIMSAINVTATTVGVTQYEASISGGSSTITMTTVNGTSGTPVGTSWQYTANGIVEVTTDSDNSGGGSVGEDDLIDITDGVVRGRATIYELSTSAGTPTNNSIVYNGGFYTICYNQSEPLAVPNASMTISGQGGFGIAFSKNTQKIGVYPFENDSQLGFSSYNQDGTRYQDYRWNIGATAIVATAGIWIEDSTGNRDPVVCNSALQYAIEKINASLEALGESVGKNAKDTAYALSVAQKALNRANTAINNSIVDVKMELKGSSFESYSYTVNVIATKKNGTEITTGGEWFLGTKHYHKVNYQIKSGQLTITSGAATSDEGGAPHGGAGAYSPSTIFNGSAAMSFTASEGTIKLTITIADKEGEASFNIADTAFYRSHAYAGFGIGTAGTIGSTTAYDSTVTWNASTQQLSTNYTIMSPDETVVASGTINVAAKKAYDAGWAAAIAHAKAKAKAVNGDLSGKVTMAAHARRSMSQATAPINGTDTTVYYGGYWVAPGDYYTGSGNASIDWSDVSATPVTE